MKDFISFDIISNLTNIDIYNLLCGGFPDIGWRMGDSDMQGTYVSGLTNQGVSIQFWTGEAPISASISFRAFDKVTLRIDEDFVKLIINFSSNNIGKIININQ